VRVTAAKPYSIDQNLWHTSYEGGILEDPAVAPADDMFQLTRDPSLAPDEPAFVEIAFESGLPVALNGRRLGPAELVSTLNAIAGAHGVGRIDLVENRLVGMKSRGVYETPAGTVLTAALRDLESLTLDRETHHFRETISSRYAELVYYGLWHSPLRAAFDAFLESSHRWVTGTVRMKLFKGFALAVARSSPSSLYRYDLATFGEDGVYDQKDAAGFNNLWALPTRVVAAVRREAAGGAAAESPASVPVATE
jgi:argininosuccinate synthase